MVLLMAHHSEERMALLMDWWMEGWMGLPKAHHSEERTDSLKEHETELPKVRHLDESTAHQREDY